MDYAPYRTPAFRRASENCFRRRSPSSTVVVAAWVNDRSRCLDVRFSCAVAWAWALLRFSPSRSPEPPESEFLFVSDAPVCGGFSDCPSPAFFQGPGDGAGISV